MLELYKMEHLINRFQDEVADAHAKDKPAGRPRLDPQDNPEWKHERIPCASSSCVHTLTIKMYWREDEE